MAPHIYLLWAILLDFHFRHDERWSLCWSSRGSKMKAMRQRSLPVLILTLALGPAWAADVEAPGVPNFHEKAGRCQVEF